MYVYVLCRFGSKIGRLGLSMQPPRRGDLRMDWFGVGRLGGFIGRATLLDDRGSGIMPPLDVKWVKIKATGVMLAGEQMSFRSKSPKAKAWRDRQAWFAVHTPLNLAEEYEAWMAQLIARHTAEEAAMWGVGR